MSLLLNHTNYSEDEMHYQMSCMMLLWMSSIMISELLISDIFTPESPLAVTLRSCFWTFAHCTVKSVVLKCHSLICLSQPLSVCILLLLSSLLLCHELLRVHFLLILLLYVLHLFSLADWWRWKQKKIKLIML